MRISFKWSTIKLFTFSAVFICSKIPEMQVDTDLGEKHVRQRAYGFLNRYAGVYQLYLGYGMRSLSAEFRIWYYLSRTKDEKGSLRYKELSQRRKDAFDTTALDQRLEIGANELSESQGSRPARILEAFALLAAKYASIDSALGTDIQAASSMIDDAEQELTKLANELPQLEADVQSIEAFLSSIEPYISKDDDCRGLTDSDRKRIESWVDTTSRLIEAKCPIDGRHVLCYEQVVGNTAAEERLNKAKQELGIIRVFEKGDEANATVVPVEDTDQA
jgi:hypothetical protein